MFLKIYLLNIINVHLFFSKQFETNKISEHYFVVKIELEKKRNRLLYDGLHFEILE